MSVDGALGFESDYVKNREKQIRQQGAWTWPNVYDPQGFAGVMRRLNVSGYGLVLIAPDGKVLGKGIRMDSVEPMLDRLFTAAK